MKHFISSLSVLCANTPPCEGRVSSRKILSLLLILFLSIGNVWAEEIAMSSFSAKAADMDSYISYTTAKGGGTSDPLVNSNQIRLYQGDPGGNITISAKEGATITEVTIGSAMKTAIKWEIDGTKDATNTSLSVNGKTTKSGISTNSITCHCYGTDKNSRLYVNYLKVVYTIDGGASEKVLSSIEISGDLTKKTYEEGDELDLTGLTVQANYESGDPKDVTNDVEWSYEPLTAGQTSVTVTATYEEKTATKTVTKTITGLIVNEHIITPNEYCIVPNNAFWGTSYNGSDANAATTLSGTQNDISILHTKSGSNLYVNNTQTRVYTNHAMQISVPSGYVITSIAFTADGNNWEGTHTANVGKMTDSKNWAGFANEVTITFGGTCRITNICVNYIKDAKYALTITEPAAGTGTLVVKDGENALTSGAEIYEGTKLTVTATPETGYEEGVVAVKNASDEDVTATVYADGVLTMPAYAVTISATFEKKPCTLLTTPVVTATPTYNSATLTWAAVANAAKYSVTVGETTTEVTEPTYTATGLNAETTYTYQVQAIAEAEQDMYCDSEVAEGSFTTTAAPVATLTLSDIEGTTTQTGALNGTITLPTTAAECSKTFVGWDSKSDCAVAPEYAPGAEYTLAAENQTLYAVYADGEGGGTVTIKHNVPTTGTSTNMTGQNDAETFFGLDNDEWSILSAKNGAQNHIGVNKDGTLRLYYHANGGSTLTITAPKDVASIVLNCNSSYKNAWVKVDGNLVSPIDGVYSINAKTFVIGNANTENKQVYVQSIEVTLAGVFSNYSTTCTAALEKPTFSVAEGTYTEAKSIELSATEGTIYYTLDGSTPTASSEKYTTPIVLDECGTTTIKAIAISTESQSPVASATYTINLPITNTAATAYTPTEAIAIIDGACDKSEEVYVKGVVVSTSEFNATYGNYDVIVKAVDDNSATPTTFTFYRMYKAASETKFTASDEVIGVGDIITAKGVLKKYNSTYELADGCYMVERVAFTEPKTDISNTFETAYTVDKAFELISDVKSDLDKEVYVKGLVAVASTELYEEKYLTYSISDNGQTTGNVLKVYDGLDINGVAFTSKDDVKVGDYVVVKGKLLNYKGTYEINKDNQLVEHISAATITIADITMEVGETKTIAATITPDAAKTEVAYSIKENAANAISLSGNTITANAVGTATITATIATAADYMGKTIDFTVTVNAKSTKEKVVILAQYEGQWYAMKAQYVTGRTSHLAPLPVTYFDGKLYNVNEADKALIEWERAVVDGKATFYNDGKYLTGKSGDTDLTLAATACEWTISEDSYLIGARTFLYNAENNWFRNFGTGNAGNKNYSDMPTVTAPVYATGDIVYTRTVTPGNLGTICLPFNVPAGKASGATFYTLAGKDANGRVAFDEVTGELAAGKSYLFQANAAEIVCYCGTTSVSSPDNTGAMKGTFGDLKLTELSNIYYFAKNALWSCEDLTELIVPANCAYVDMGTVTAIKEAAPVGVRRITLGVNGQNTATGVDQVQGDEVPTKMIINGQLFILRGEKMYDAQGKLVK